MLTIIERPEIGGTAENLTELTEILKNIGRPFIRSEIFKCYVPDTGKGEGEFYIPKLVKGRLAKNINECFIPVRCTYWSRFFNSIVFVTDEGEKISYDYDYENGVVDFNRPIN